MKNLISMLSCALYCGTAIFITMLIVNMYDNKLILEPNMYNIENGTYWTTSKAGTVLEIKTMFKFSKRTGITWVLNHGEWVVIREN